MESTLRELRAPYRIAGSDVPIIAIDIPVLFEDDGYEEMGESVPHTTATSDLRICISAHLCESRNLSVFSDLNLFYHPIVLGAYVSPDLMVVEPFGRLPFDIDAYRIDTDGKRPLLVIEVLSKRSIQQGDLTLKPDIYAFAAVPEYVLVDPLRQFMPDRLLLKRLQADGSWRNEKDADDGVTSNLGFRIKLDEFGRLSVFHTETGHQYVRPDEAIRIMAEIEANRRDESGG